MMHLKLIWKTLNQIYLNDGTGEACAGQSNAICDIASRSYKLNFVSETNFGIVPPMGSTYVNNYLFEKMFFF